MTKRKPFTATVRRWVVVDKERHDPVCTIRTSRDAAALAAVGLSSSAYVIRAEVTIREVKP